MCACALLAACSDDPAPRLPQTQPSQTAPSPSPSPGEVARGCDVARQEPPAEVPHYDMSIRIDPQAGEVKGTSRVSFVADRATRRLVFRLWPNGPRLSSEGTELVVRRASRRFRSPDPTTAVFPLGRRLAPGETAEVRLHWTLRLPGAIYDRISQNGDTIRLGSFFPILSWEGGRGWATDPPTSTLAESSTSPTADFTVRIEAAGLDVIATGEETAPGRWSASAVRDFAVAVGDFEMVERSVRAPNRVALRVGVARGVDAGPDDFAGAIERALEDLSGRYGAYPWRTFSMAIVPDLGGSGIEYPAMIFQGEDSLRNATTHEVAHSWFYGLVGNNQGRDPWLDEGVTSWAQARADGILDFFRDYEIPEEAAGRLGSPMTFWDDHESVYYPGAYVQGVKALEALGDPRRVDCALRRFVAENAYEVATYEDLIDALEPSFPRAGRVLARFGARS